MQLPQYLVDEYEVLVAELDNDFTDSAIVSAMVVEGDWTIEGARAILKIARDYGTSMLGEAFALAAALKIVDGDLGF